MTPEATRYAFVVPGRPVPAKRMTRWGKYVSPAAQRHLDHKATIGWAAKAAGVRPIDGPVWLRCRFYLYAGHTADVSNLVKLVEDGLNGIAYEDDAQITEVVAHRLVAWRRAEQRTEVEVGAIGGDADG